MPEINTIVHEDGLCDLQVTYSGISKATCQNVINTLLSDGIMNNDLSGGILTIQGQKTPDVEKVMCIKILREIATYGLGLKEAKDFVEGAFGGHRVMVAIDKQKLSLEHEIILKRNFITVAFS